MSDRSSPNRPSVAVVGAGVSGLTAAHVLAGEREVTLFEADVRLGGHAHTHDVPARRGESAQVSVDSGFIVHNERTYPHLLRLFADLGIETRPTEMSMSITCSTCGLSWAGGRGPRGFFAQRRRAVDPRFLRMLADVPRFHREARAILDAEAGDGDVETTWGDFLRSGGYSEYFIRHFAIPLVSCVWSADEADALAYPARHLFAFLDHHGMLTVTGAPTWRTVVGGSRTYVEKLAARLPDVRRRVPVLAITRHADGVEIRTADDRTEWFDQVVVATHADQALAVLADASPAEKDDLGAIGYSTNRTVLHRDGSILPRSRGARAAWNHRTSCGSGAGTTGVSVSYWMNLLQGLPGDDLVVTLNGADAIDPGSVIAEMSYAHPIFTPDAIAAAARLRTAGGDRLAFAGAHLGWGFHEDGCRSGVEAAARLGVSW